MTKKSSIIALLVTLMLGLSPVLPVNAAIHPNPYDSQVPLPQNTTTTGQLLGCGAAVFGEGTLANKGYFYKIDWAIKHSLNNDNYIVTVKDNAGEVNLAYQGQAGGITATYVLPTVTYNLTGSQSTQIVTLTVTAYKADTLAVNSTIQCQTTLTNKLVPSPTTTDNNTTTLPGLQEASSGPVQSSTENAESTSAASSATPETETPAPNPSLDILTCKGSAPTLYFENDAPAYDRMGVDCTLAMPGMISAGIYSDAYDPKAEDNSGNLIKMIAPDTLKQKGRFYLSWNGYDDYDQAVPMEKYKFVVEARPADNFLPDASVHAFQIANPPAELPADTQPAEGNGTEAGTAEALHGAAAEEDNPGLLEQLGEAVFGSEAAGEEAAATAAQPASREASKCPTVFYPIDISGHPYEALIKKAYDECLIKGYADGTFRVDQGLTRAEAAKIIVLASGNLAKQGCYDSDCGSPFMDLDMWQGPWVRAAWELQIVSGIAADRFAPNREITRAEAVALTVKAFKIAPHYGCYDADCGAGLPNDPFNDITQMWQGQYLRALTDKGVLQTLSPGRFYPDQAITRGQFVEMIYRVKSLE